MPCLLPIIALRFTWSEWKILQLGDQGKLVKKKFKGADLLFITETKAIADPPEGLDPFFPVTHDTPLSIPSADKILNL